MKNSVINSTILISLAAAIPAGAMVPTDSTGNRALATPNTGPTPAAYGTPVPRATLPPPAAPTRAVSTPAPSATAAYSSTATPYSAPAPASAPVPPQPRVMAPAPPAPPAAAGKSIKINTVKRAPQEYLELGEVVGLAPAALSQLGLKDGDIVEIKAASGKSIGAEVKSGGSDAATLLAKKSTRESLGIEEGAGSLQVNSISWPSGDPKPAPVNFATVAKPPKPFLKLGKVVGVSLQKMKEMNASPMQKAIMTGPNGKKEIVGIVLLDRGPDTIFMRGGLRKTLGIDAGPAKIMLEPKPGKMQPADTGTTEDGNDPPE